MKYKFESLEKVAEKVQDGVFDLYPYYTGMVYDYDDCKTSQEMDERIRGIAEKAKEFGKPCVCKIACDDGKERVFGTNCAKGCSSRFFVFNVKECEKEESDFRLIIYNTGRGALTTYWWDRWVKASVGDFV